MLVETAGTSQTVKVATVTVPVPMPSVAAGAPRVRLDGPAAVVVQVTLLLPGVVS
jgi:hypothetical protein